MVPISVITGQLEGKHVRVLFQEEMSYLPEDQNVPWRFEREVNLIRKMSILDQDELEKIFVCIFSTF